MGGRPQPEPQGAQLLIAVDTSVWIDVLRGAPTPQVGTFHELVRRGAELGLTDIVFTELLQGFADPRQARMAESRMRELPILRLEQIEDFVLAADLYKQARRSGVTIRNALDCLIAAPCVRTDTPILHADADFDRLASCTPLRVFA